MRLICEDNLRVAY